MASTKAEDYRHYADDARKRAEAADNDWVKRNWLKIAEDWLKLAESVEAEEALTNKGRKAKGE
jgi:hypothetical protein